MTNERKEIKNGWIVILIEKDQDGKEWPSHIDSILTREQARLEVLRRTIGHDTEARMIPFIDCWERAATVQMTDGWD